MAPREPSFENGIIYDDKDLNVRKTSMAILAIFQSISWFVITDEKLVSPDDYIRDSIELIINSISKQG